MRNNLNSLKASISPRRLAPRDSFAASPSGSIGKFISAAQRRFCQRPARAWLEWALLALFVFCLGNAQAQEAAPAAPAGAAATATNNSPRNIRFQFDGIPYSDVLERFAQMAGKPLVTDTNLTGTLTYNDPQPYSYVEALDTLNIILSMKGMMLMEDGPHLRLVPFKQLPQMPLKILRGLDEASQARPGEIVTVVLPVNNLDAKEIADAVQSMVSSAGSLASLSRGRGLIITDKLANIQRIKTLLSAIDLEAVADRQMKAYTLLHASGAVVADLINRTFGIATAPKRTQFNAQTKQLDVLPPDPNDYITAVYDDASRTLVLFGPRERLGLAEELVSKFENKEGGAGEVRIYYPQITKAEELAQMIRQTVPGVAAQNETASAAATKARVIADRDQNRLIVAAPLAGQLDQIEMVVNKLDKPVHGTGGGSSQATRSQTVQVTKIFHPRTADAASVGKILSEALSRRTPSGVVLPTATVSVEAKTQTVVVTGSPGDVQTAVDIVTQLETGSSMPMPQQTRFLEVGGVAEAKRLSPLIEQIYRSQVTDSLGGQVAHAKILADSETGKLIVTASEDHLKKIEGIVRQLVQERAKPEPRPLQIIPLKHLRVESALANINSLVNDRLKEKRFENLPAPSILADAPNNRLLVTATAEQSKEIQTVVSTVDISPEAAARQMFVLPVRSKPASELIALATQLLTQLGQEQPNPQLVPKLIADPSGKQIIVLAIAPDLQKITNLVQQLDTAAAPVARDFRGVEIFSRTAAELTPLVQQLYQEQLKGQSEPAGGPATLLPDARNNRVMISGSEKEIARVEGIIRTLDPAEKRGAREETRVIRLKTGVAADMASLVEKSLNAQSQHVKVLVDARSNSLVVTGEAAAVDAAGKMIEQLDTRSDAAPKDIRIIELKQGEPASVALMLTTLSTEILKDQRGSEYNPQLKILPDAVGNRLIITGPKDELASIGSIIEKVNQPAEAGGGARVFKLNMADPVTVANVISNAMIKFDQNNQIVRRVSVSPDLETRSVIVSGARTDLLDVESIIQRLDSEGGDKNRSLKLLDVRTDDLDGLVNLAYKVFTAQNSGRNVTNLFSITPEPSGKRLIILAPPTMLPELQTVIETLDVDQSGRSLQAVELKNANGSEILGIVNRIYTEQSKGKSIPPASVYADTGGTRLMVFGTKEQAATVEQIVRTLESETRVTRETKVFEVGKLSEAQRILPLAQQLYRDQIRNSGNPSAADAQMVSDGKTGRVIVSARQEQMAQIEEIITRLQVTAPNPQPARETKIFEVGNGNEAQRLLPLVKQLYEDQWKDKIETDPADAQIVADARTGRLIVTGKPEHLKQIETIVAQLTNGKPSASANEARIFDLTTANAAELSTTLRTLYQENARSRLGSVPADLLILADPSANRLVVSGDTNELAVVEDLIKRLDKVAAQSASTRVFKLKSADPDKVLEILTSALMRYDNYGRAQKRISVVVDAKTRTLIATGDPRDLQGASVIIEQLDSVGVQPERKMKVVAIEKGKAAEVSSKVRQLYQDQIKSQPELGVADALILEDIPSNQLILAGSEAQLALIEQIISQLQEHARLQGPRETKIIEVGAAEEVSRLQGLVQGLYTDHWKSKAAGDPADATIMADTRNGRLIVTGRSDHLQEIERIIGQLKMAASANETRETRVYDLNTTSAGELATTVRTLYQEYLKSHPVLPASQAVILPDVAANRLVVAGTTNELAAIDEIVQKLDKVDAQSGRTRVFKLKTAEAEQVAMVLSTGLAQISQSGRNIPRVTVGTDKQNNLLIVSGEPKDLQAASIIVEQMDALLAKEPRQIRIVPLTNGVASQVALRLRTLYQEQMKGQPRSGAADALIMGEDGSNRLIITATESHTKIIEDILKQLEEIGQNVQRQFRVVSLQRNSAASVATMVSQLFARQMSSQDPSDRLLITPSTDDRMLVLDAPAATLERIDQLVKMLDGEGTAGHVEVHTYHVPDGNAADLAQSLARLFSERGDRGSGDGSERRSRSGLAVAPRFEADPAGNILMVAATKPQFAQVEKLIEELKKTAQVASEIRTFPLRHNDPAQMAEMLQAMLTGEEMRQPGEGRPRRMQWRPGVGLQPVTDLKGIRVAPAMALQAVIVQGPPDKLLLAEKLINTLDQELTDSKSVIQTVHLKKAQAESLAEAVNKTITARGQQGRLQRVNVTAVPGPNSVLVNGPEDAVKEVLEVIRELDQESEDAEIKVHIYKLENGNAKELSSIVEQLLQNLSRSMSRRAASSSSPGGSSRMVQPSVSVEPHSNSLVISGTAAHFRLVEQLLKTLDKAPERSEKDVQFVWLRNAKALDVALKIEAVFSGRKEEDKPFIESDAFNNSITIIGKRSDIAQIQDLINRLDESSKDTSLQVRLRPLDRVPAEQMSRMLQNIYPQMSSGLIRIVEKLPIGQPAKTNGNGLPPVPPATPDTTTPPAPGAAQKSEIPEVIIAVDKNANALLLSGPAQELDQIDRIIFDLSFTYISSDAEFRVIPLKEADPVIVARTLGELFKPDPVPVQPQQQQQRPGEVRMVTPAPKVTVVAEPRTRSVIVRAKPTDFTLLETLIKQLDIAGLSAQLEYRLVTLTNAPPEKIVPLVQQLVMQLNLIRPGEPLTVTADPRTRSLLVVARDTTLAQVEKMIHSLDTPSPFTEAEVLVLAIKKANAPQLAAVLQSMLKPGAAGEQTPESRELQEQVRRLKVTDENGKNILLDLSKPIKIMADPISGQGGGNRLIISSTPENLKGLAAVVEMMDSVSIIDGVDVKLVALEHADAAAVSQTLNSIFSQGQRLAIGPAGRAEPEGVSGKALTHPLNIAVDNRSNSLILSGQKESLELAGKIIKDLDRKLDRFVTEVKLFRLKHATATRLAPLLQSVFSEGPAIPGTEGLNTQVTRLLAAMPNETPQLTEQAKIRSALVVQADDTSNILVVAARTDALPLIETVINQLDIPSASGLDTIRVYTLNHSDAVNVQRVVNDLFSGPRATQLRTEDKPNITIDARTQALIVSGNTKAFAIIDSLISQLDRELPLELRDVRILTLEHADAAQLADQLQKLLDARVAQKSTLSRQQAESMRALIIPEPRSNSILVTGSKDSFDLIESLARELDKAPTALSGRIRLVPLEYADARIVSSALLNLFTQRYQASRSPELQRNRPIIVPDPRSNGLLVAASVEDNAVIDDLLQKLDRKLSDPALTLTVLPLKHNDAGRLASTLEGIFSARLRARTVPGQPVSPQDEVSIETDSLNNALVVSASRENLETLRELLEKIDVEPVAADGIIQTFTLEYADAQRVSTMLRSLVQQGLYRPGMPLRRGGGEGGGGGGLSRRDALAITVDSRSNTLIVSASPENLLIVREIIKQVDTKDFAEAGNVRLYQLKHAKASSLSTVLDQFFRAKRSGEASVVNAPERSLPVVIIPDDRVNTLVVTGSKESFDVIDRLIAQLDAEDTMSRLTFKVFPLKQATATKLQNTLQRLFVNRPSRVKGEPPDPIVVVADPWVNALIISASVDDMSMVTSLIERLDAEQADLGTTVQVLPLAKADARQVSQTLQGLYRTFGGQAQGAGGFAVSVSADERLNAIIVSAGEADLKRISELVKKLDTDQVARVSEIRVFPLRYAKADSLSMILNTALNTKPASLTEQSPNSASVLQFITQSMDGSQLVASALKEGVLITPDTRMNSLIISAPVDYIGLLEQIISRLDSSEPQKAKIKVFNLVNADARQMAELLMSLFRLQPSGLPSPGSQRSIQYTLVKQRVEIPVLPDPLDPGAAFVTTETNGPSAVVGSDEQNALHVTVDPRTNSLLVGGTEHYVALVSDIIETLDSSSAQERKTEVYRLKNAQAGELQLAVRSFLDQDRQRITQVLGQDAVGTAQRMLEREVAIVAETNSNTLLLSANPRYFDQVKALIEELDQPQSQVLIQVLLAEVTLDNTRDLGIEWNVTKSVEDAKLATGTDFGVLNELRNFGGYSAAVTGSDYNFLLRALENEGRLEVLSRPQILTADNKPATINIGQRVPLITDSRVTQFGDTINSFQYQNVGVNLAVTPRIGSDGSVQMEISTTNSALSSSSVEISSSTRAVVKMPIINERRATTSVSVQSGQSIIMGGLISTSEDQRIKKVPFLGDIPYLGALFRSKTRIADRKELLILLTPQVLVSSATVPRLMDTEAFTEQELERSSIQDQIQRRKNDPIRNRMLDSMFPEKTNTVPANPVPPRDSAKPNGPST